MHAESLLLRSFSEKLVRACGASPALPFLQLDATESRVGKTDSEAELLRRQRWHKKVHERLSTVQSLASTISMLRSSCEIFSLMFPNRNRADSSAP